MLFIKEHKEAVILVAVLFGVFIAAYLWFANHPMVIVSGESMNPTYYDGELLEGESFTKLEYGDVVVFTSDSYRGTLIKRVIALPGDRIRIDAAGVYLNGTLLIEPYEKTDVYGLAESEILVGENEYFVMGDNRNNSYDSRMLGTISKDSIRYKVSGVSPINNTVFVQLIRMIGWET